MKLLVDENLAPELAADLADLFPSSIHVSSGELGSTPDAVIWEYAKAHGFTFLIEVAAARARPIRRKRRNTATVRPG